MDESWLEAWELPSPPLETWGEKESLIEEQVQQHASLTEEELEGHIFNSGVDLLRCNLSPTCENGVIDLTGIIGNLLDQDRSLEAAVVGQPEYFSATKDGCIGGLDVDFELLTQFTGAQPVTYDWTNVIGMESTSSTLPPDINTAPVTIAFEDLLPTTVANELFAADDTTHENCIFYVENEDDSNAASATAVEEIATTLDRRKKGARKRKVQDEDADCLPMAEDEEVSSSKSGRVGIRGGAKATAVLDKDSAEYRMRRDRNNKFVRASREKSRRRQEEIEQNLNRVTGENKELRSRVESLTREVEILRGLFRTIGAEIPRDVVERINVASHS
jgi:hypothetical protein